MERGYSYIEALIVVALISTLSSVSVPSLGAMRAKSNLQSDVIVLTSIIERFASLSLMTGKQYEITIDPPVIAVMTDDNRTKYRSELIRSRLDNPDKPHLITVYPGGIVSPTTIRLTGGLWSCSIIISLRGRVRSTC